MNDLGKLVVDFQFGGSVQGAFVAELVQLIEIGGIQQAIVDDVFLADFQEHRVLDEHVLKDQAQHVAEKNDVGRDKLAEERLRRLI